MEINQDVIYIYIYIRYIVFMHWMKILHKEGSLGSCGELPIGCSHLKDQALSAQVILTQNM